MKLNKQGVRDLSSHVNARKVSNQELCIHDWQHDMECHCQMHIYLDELHAPCMEICRKCKRRR